MPQLPDSITIILGISTLLASILYFREYFLRKKISSDQQKLSVETKQKAALLLNSAEIAQTEILAQGKYQTNKFISEFQAQIQKLIDNSQKSLALSQDNLIKFMADLQKRSQEFENASRISAENRINKTFDNLESRLSEFLISTEQKTTSSIELELKAARELIETYKAQQLKLIDENILAMMEQTLNIVLGKKLSLKEHLDLVYESLERAKIEKFVV